MSIEEIEGAGQEQAQTAGEAQAAEALRVAMQTDETVGTEQEPADEEPADEEPAEELPAWLATVQPVTGSTQSWPVLRPVSPAARHRWRLRVSWARTGAVSSSLTPSRSLLVAGGTLSAPITPAVSTTLGRFRPTRCLAPSEPRAPPTAVVVTDGRSLAPARGCGARPQRMCSCWRRSRCPRSQVPSRPQVRKECYPGCHGGPSWGNRRQAQPARRTDRMAFTLVRRGCWRGRPLVASGGRKGCTTRHSASERSVS